MRRLSPALGWFPRLMRASAEAPEVVEISARGLHREALDEDISAPNHSFSPDFPSDLTYLLGSSPYFCYHSAS